MSPTTRNSSATSAKRCRRSASWTRTWSVQLSNQHLPPPSPFPLPPPNQQHNPATHLSDPLPGRPRGPNLPLRGLVPRGDGRGQHHQGLRQLHQRLHRRGRSRGRLLQRRRRRRRRRRGGREEERAGFGRRSAVLEEFGELHEGEWGGGEKDGWMDGFDLIDLIELAIGSADYIVGITRSSRPRLPPRRHHLTLRLPRWGIRTVPCPPGKATTSRRPVVLRA